MFAKFCQDTFCRFRVKECDVQTLCSFSRGLVDQSDSFFVTFSQRVGYTVFYTESDMMHTVVAFVEPFLNGTLW